MRYKRILLKLSGEVLMGNEGHGIDHAVVADIAGQIGESAARCPGSIDLGGTTYTGGKRAKRRDGPRHRD
jgi:uridylate kinase